MKNILTCAAIAGAALLASNPAAAATVFSSGPISAQNGGYTINSGFSISSSFTLAATTTITGFTFGGWTFPAETLSSVGYGLSSAATPATTATTTLSAGALIPGGFGFYNVREYTGTIASTVLGAGTYYLTLGSAAGSTGAFWDVNNNGVSQSSQYLNGAFFQNTPGLAFTIVGDAGGVPEPATWALMILGFGAVGGALRRRRPVTATVRFA